MLYSELHKFDYNSTKNCTFGRYVCVCGKFPTIHKLS